LVSLSNLIAVWSQAELARGYRQRLLKGYGAVDWLWLLDIKSGEINYCSIKEADMASIAHLNAQRVVIYTLQVVTLLVIVFLMSPAVTLLAIAVHGVIALVNAWTGRQVVKVAADSNRAYTALSNELTVLQQNRKFLKTSLLNLKMIRT